MNETIGTSSQNDIKQEKCSMMIIGQDGLTKIVQTNKSLSKLIGLESETEKDSVTIQNCREYTNPICAPRKRGRPPNSTRRRGRPMKKYQSSRQSVEQANLPLTIPEINSQHLSSFRVSTPFNRFLMSTWSMTEAKFQTIRPWQLGNFIISMWQSLPLDDKEKYFDAYNKECIDCAQIGYSAVQDLDGISNNSTNKFILNSEENDMNSDIPDERQIAYERFTRNHSLILSILSDTIVPGIHRAPREELLYQLDRLIILQNRVKVLEKLTNQWTSTNIHLRKVKEEDEEKFKEFSKIENHSMKTFTVL